MDIILKAVRGLIALYFEGCAADTFDDAIRKLDITLGKK